MLIAESGYDCADPGRRATGLLPRWQLLRRHTRGGYGQRAGAGGAGAGRTRLGDATRG